MILLRLYYIQIIFVMIIQTANKLVNSFVEHMDK